MWPVHLLSGPREAGAQLTASAVQSRPRPGEYAATLDSSLVPGNLSVNTFLHMHRYTVDLCLSFSPGNCVRGFTVTSIKNVEIIGSIWTVDKITGSC